LAHPVYTEIMQFMRTFGRVHFLITFMRSWRNTSSWCRPILNVTPDDHVYANHNVLMTYLKYTQV